MCILSNFVVFVAIVAVLTSQQVSAKKSVMPNMCSPQEETALPCVCCKKGCWFGIAEMTTAYFGHIPGERSEAEATFTLAMMRQCFQVECADACPLSQ